MNKANHDENAYEKLKRKVNKETWKPLKEFESTFSNTRGMSSFEKTLVIMKRILNYLYTTDTFDNKDGNSPDEILKTEFKTLIKKILQNGDMKGLYNFSFIYKKGNKAGVDIFDQLSFDDVYSIFLNPGKFMETNEDKQNVIALAENIQWTINDVMQAVDNVQNFTSSVKDAFDPKNEKNNQKASTIESEKETHYQKETVEFHNKTVDKITEEITKTHADGSTTFIKKMIGKRKWVKN